MHLRVITLAAKADPYPLRYNFKNGRECSMETEIIRIIDDFEHWR